MKTTSLLKNPGRLLKGFDRLFSRLVLPWMVITLSLYIFVHSPARAWINAALGLTYRGCLFFCNYSLTMVSISQLLSALVLLGTGALAAWAIVDHFDGPTYDRLLAFGIAALALIIVPATLLGMTAYFTQQHFMRAPAGPLLSTLPSLVIAGAWLRQGWRPHLPTIRFENPGPLSHPLLLITASLAAALLLSIIAISLAHPPTGYDALGYHGPMSVFLWQEGNLGSFLDRDPVTWALAQPGAAEIWIGLLRMIGGQPLANLGQLPFALLGCAAVYAFTRRLGLLPDAALLAASAFLLMPMVVMQSGMQLNDLAGAAVWMSAAALACRPLPDWDKGWLRLISICLGLVVTTKLVLVPGALIIGLFILVVLLRQACQVLTRKRAWTWIALMALCFLGVVAPWWLRNLAQYGNPVYPQALPLVGHGYNYAAFEKADLAFVPRPAAWLIYPLLEQHEEQSGLGAVFALTCPPGLYMAVRQGKRLPMILFTALTAGMILIWWLLSEHFPRFLLGPAGLCMAFVPWALLSVPRNMRRLAEGLVASAAIFSVLVTFYQALIPFARQSNNPAEFYNQVWGVDPAAQLLPESDGLLWETGYAPDLPEYTAYLPLLGPSSQRLVLPSNHDKDTGALSQKMKTNGIQYAYVPASPQSRGEVEKLFDPQTFDLVSQSAVIKGNLISPRRPIFQPATSAETNQAITRYLFKLK